MIRSKAPECSPEYATSLPLVARATAGDRCAEDNVSSGIPPLTEVGRISGRRGRFQPAPSIRTAGSLQAVLAL